MEYSISRWTVDGGGRSAGAAGPYILGGTAGQPDAGRLSGLNFMVAGGFWGTLAAAVVGVADSVDQQPVPIGPPPPNEVRVLAPAPNPLIHRTRITFDLPDTRDVTVQIFGIDGAVIRTLAEGSRPPGRHVLEWDARNGTGHRVSPGIYFVRVRLGTLQQSLKLVVMQ